MLWKIDTNLRSLTHYTNQIHNITNECLFYFLLLETLQLRKLSGSASLSWSDRNSASQPDQTAIILSTVTKYTFRSTTTTNFDFHLKKISKLKFFEIFWFWTRVIHNIEDVFGFWKFKSRSGRNSHHVIFSRSQVSKSDRAPIWHSSKIFCIHRKGFVLCLKCNFAITLAKRALEEALAVTLEKS